MDPRSKHHSAMHQFLISGRGAVAVEFAIVLPIILLIIWAFWQMSESYRLQWTLNRQTAPSPMEQDAAVFLERFRSFHC